MRYDLIHSASGLPSNGPHALGSERGLPATSASAMNSVANAARSAGKHHDGRVVRVVQAGVHELDDLAAELDAHAVVVDDRRLDDVLLQLLRRRDAVAVAVDAVEEAGAHAADAGPRVGRDVDLVAVDDAVVVAVDHVARHLRVAAVHVAQHVLVATNVAVSANTAPPAA